MHYKLMFPGKYLRAVDLQGQTVAVTIEDLTHEELRGKGGESEMKWCVKMAGKEKLWVLNVTNSESIAVIYGDETDDWIGQRVVIAPREVPVGREMKLAIRVDEKKTRQLHAESAT